MSGFEAFSISFEVNGVRRGIRAAIPEALQFPVRERPSDLPLGAKLVVFDRSSAGLGDGDANWKLVLAGKDDGGDYFKLQCTSGPAVQSFNHGRRALVVPRLGSDVPIFGVPIEYWRLIEHGDQFLIQSKSNGLFWSVPRGRYSGAVQTHPYNSDFIQLFDIYSLV